MRKLLSFTLACLTALTLTACGSSSSEDSEKPDNNTSSGKTETVQQNGSEENPVTGIFHPAASGNYATIKIDPSVKMDDTSAWLGLCPPGKDYITELEADDVDVIWFGLDARENESDPYVFACDFESVEDGKYALVVATSDDENVGYVVIQLSMEKKGDDLKFDFSDAKIKDRPSK